jgi:hypothetical protein
MSAVEEMEPWETGGDESLWAVHELDRIDKHRLVLSAAVALGRIDLHGDSFELAAVKKFSGFKAGMPLPVEPAAWTPVGEGSVLAIPTASLGPGRIEATLSFEVVLSEVKILRKIPAAAALVTLADAAEKAITRLIPLV